MIRIGFDVGGTFTDFTVLDARDGSLRYFKTPSTPADPSEAIETGLRALFGEFGIVPNDVSFIGHGTTVATNMVIERRGVRTGLITTKGFRDVLEIGRQTRPSLYDYSIANPPPLVPRALQLARDAVPDVVADILLVDEDLVDGAARPGPPQIRADALGVQQRGDLVLAAPLLDEAAIDPADRIHLLGRPRHEDHAVRLKALVLAAGQRCLAVSGTIQEMAAQSEPRRTALAEPKLDQPTLPGKDTDGEQAATLASEGALDALDDRGNRTAVILEAVNAIFNPDAGLAALILVEGALVGVLEASPTADVVDQDQVEIRPPGSNIVDQALEAGSASEAQAALAVVGIGADDLDAAFLRILPDRRRLVLGGVALVVGRHPDVFGRTPPDAF